jgi:alpha,alpha-trehalase
VAVASAPEVLIPTARRIALALALAISACAARPAQQPLPAQPAQAAGAAKGLSPERVARLRTHIRDAWPLLTRTLSDLPRAAHDDKLPPRSGRPWPVYFPPAEDRHALEAALAKALPAEAIREIALRPLPVFATAPTYQPVAEHGLLYLPRPYVVPGGRFNEMYGWDSYFIVLGLLRDDRATLARDMVDDFLYEVAHYGGVLNANRTYYLTRSQPPLLSGMTLAVFRATQDRTWLARARDALVAHHRHWIEDPHLIPRLGLSRYFDHGSGPAPEVVAGERDAAGQSHYDRVRASLRVRNDPAFDLYYDRARDALTPLFYQGDRAMRESGFDPTGRFGPFGAETTRIAPVCLNTLLYQMERDLAEIETVLGRPAEAAAWLTRARDRQGRVEALLWDEPAGLYLDYDAAGARRRAYPFATTFWPLWSGLASPAHARRVRDNLAQFDRPGGVSTSTQVTGAQWDAPFGWAPLQLFAVEGLRRYGFRQDADRIARAFLSMLAEDLERRGTLVEKYDVERRTSDVRGKLAFGYTSNEIGFGWTNGVALELLAAINAAESPASSPKTQAR